MNIVMMNIAIAMTMRYGTRYEGSDGSGLDGRDGVEATIWN
jgi:hypothetical protein